MLFRVGFEVYRASISFSNDCFKDYNQLNLKRTNINLNYIINQHPIEFCDRIVLFRIYIQLAGTSIVLAKQYHFACIYIHSCQGRYANIVSAVDCSHAFHARWLMHFYSDGGKITCSIMDICYSNFTSMQWLPEQRSCEPQDTFQFQGKLNLVWTLKFNAKCLHWNMNA